MANRKLITTVAFVVVVGGVLATFIVLGNQGHPPDMPSHSAPHILRFNLKNELMGTEADPPLDPLAASSQPGFKYDERAAAEQINHGCEACHAMCSDSGPTAGQPPCRVAHHPPKTECIKCHRMGPR